MVRSIAVNVVVLLLGLVLLGTALLLGVVHALAQPPSLASIGPLIFLVVLGLWCTIGSIENLRRHRSWPEGKPPLKSYVLVKWNLAILVASFVGSVAFLIFGNAAPDPTPLQRGLGIVMVFSLFSVPVVLFLFLVEKALDHHRAGSRNRPGG